MKCWYDLVSFMETNIKGLNMSISLSGSVGLGGRNKPTDVAMVQSLLNNSGSFQLEVDGLADSKTYEAIRSFQKTTVKLFKPDSLISPHGKTFKHLKLLYAENTLPADQSNTAISASKFSRLYQKQYAALSIASVAGLTSLVSNLTSDPDISDIRWSAYMLATTKRETAHTMLPIEEYGKGKNRPYGKEVTVKDKSGKEYKNTYYGRGYVQLTWDENYKKMSSALKTGETLYLYPDKVLEPDIAYKIMSHGMRHGVFTSRKLSDYINGGQCDYVNARRIINGTDVAQMISDYAKTIELLLRLSKTTTFKNTDVISCVSLANLCVA